MPRYSAVLESGAMDFMKKDLLAFARMNCYSVGLMFRSAMPNVVMSQVTFRGTLLRKKLRTKYIPRSRDGGVLEMIGLMF